MLQGGRNVVMLQGGRDVVIVAMFELVFHINISTLITRQKIDFGIPKMAKP